MSVKLRKILSLALTLGLLFQQIGFAQIATELNIAGYLSRMGSNLSVEKFRPLHLRYFSYDASSDNFKVLVDKGDLKNLSNKELESSTKPLLNFFLVGVTLPDSMFWVNLRPDSENQIIDQYLEKTDVGKIMLEADLQLKKDTASMTSPATPEGKEYWNRLYKKAAELYGYDNVTIPTLTRPWIVPGEIIVRESQDSAYIYKATLKVMLEQDYLKGSATYNFQDDRSKTLNEYSSQLIRELIIPKLTKEVNSSKRYAPLRQVYYSLILSRWFKQKFGGQKTDNGRQTNSYINLINTKNLTNLISKEYWSKTEYFNQYKKSFADGEYNIKEPVYTPTGQVIRSYFSGGIAMGASSPLNNRNGLTSDRPIPSGVFNSGVLMGGDSLSSIKVSDASLPKKSGSSPISATAMPAEFMIIAFSDLLARPFTSSEYLQDYGKERKNRGLHIPETPTLDAATVALDILTSKGLLVKAGKSYTVSSQGRKEIIFADLQRIIRVGRNNMANGVFMGEYSDIQKWWLIIQLRSGFQR